MKISEREANGVVILDMEGRITIGEGDVQMREAVEANIQQGKTNILLNMSRISYMDSSGVGELIGCLRSVGDAGGAFKLLNISKKIKDLLHLTQILSVFEYFNDEDKAVASFQ